MTYTVLFLESGERRRIGGPAFAEVAQRYEKVERLRQKDGAIQDGKVPTVKGIFLLTQYGCNFVGP